MENTPINLENILKQAPNWTFAGDYTLLQWMNKISQVYMTLLNAIKLRLPVIIVISLFFLQKGFGIEG